MGSFNEICALSNMSITPGTPVRLLFLTRNPYVKSDQRVDHRGVYHTDQWFVRTPPIKGEYADYGDIEFKESPVTDLISKMFALDVVEKPFGFNRYHTKDVTKTKNIHHFLEAASQGRLEVKDRGEREDNKEITPEHFPTWQKIHDIFREHKLPLQSEMQDGEKGYNAQPVVPGVVCVTFESFGDNTKKLESVKKILDKQYYCKIASMFDDNPTYEQALLVSPKGSFKNPSLVCDVKKIKEYMTVHPKRTMERSHNLSVLAVMIREDAWQTYCYLDVPKRSKYDEVPRSFDVIYKEIKTATAKLNKKSDLPVEVEDFLDGISLRGLMTDIPFQTLTQTHLVAAIKKDDYPEDAKAELIKDCAELTRIECLMASINQSWSIPSLGNQSPNWNIRSALINELAGIHQAELAKEDAIYAEWMVDDHDEEEEKNEDEQ